MTVMIAAVAINFSLGIPWSSLRETVATAWNRKETCAFRRSNNRLITCYALKNVLSSTQFFHFRFNGSRLTLRTSLEERNVSVVARISTCISFDLDRELNEV